MPRYIDADALTLKIDDWRVDLEETYGKNDEYVQCLESVLVMIEDAPTADVVERKKGEWEDKEVFNETDDDHIVDEWQSSRCSACGLYHTTPYSYYFYHYKYCPYCGAEMSQGEENEGN